VGDTVAVWSAGPGYVAFVRKFSYDAAVARADKLAAEIARRDRECRTVETDYWRDEAKKLAAKLERVRALLPFLADHVSVSRALADEQEPRGFVQATSIQGQGEYWMICSLCKEMNGNHTHGYGKCVERRKGVRRCETERRFYVVNEPMFLMTPTIANAMRDEREADRRRGGRG